MTKLFTQDQQIRKYIHSVWEKPAVFCPVYMYS